MALLKPENQPSTRIFRVHNKQKKLSENNLEIVCGVRPMMNDTPSTGKSTLCCNISITHTHTHTHTHTPTHPHPHPYTHPTHTKTKTKQKQTNNLFICIIMENIFEIVRGVRPIKNDTPSTGKTNLCHNILITQPTKNICLHGKLYLREKVERLRETFTGVQGAGPWRGLQGGSAP